MKAITIGFLMLAIFIAGGIVIPTVQAEWTPGENKIFFQKVAEAAEMLSNAHRLSQSLAAIADDENIATDPNFIDEAPWTKEELVAMKSVFDDFHIFVTGGATLPDENRGAKINAMLLGLQ